jgi:LysR family nod box-dependent transcriptional activator
MAAGCPVNFKGLDLNLLVALDAVLAERSVTRAADRLYLSQPAMSNALARLREYFRDPLVVQQGRQLLLTPRSQALQQPVRDVLLMVEAAIVDPAAFEPAQIDREVRILASDFASRVLLRPLFERLSAIAPKMRFSVISQGAVDAAELLDRGEVDLLIIPTRYQHPGHPAEPLFEESYVCVIWSDNENVGEQLTFDQFIAAEHVVVEFAGGRAPAFDNWFLERFGVVRRIAVRTQSLTSLCELVVGTNRIATVHRRLARYEARALPLRVCEPPLTIPNLVECAQWHRVRSHDPVLRWLIDHMRSVAAEI